jgi:hypothetical protein
VSVCFFVSGLVSPPRQPKTNSTVVVVVVAVAVVVVVVRAFITTLLQSYYHTNCSVSGVSLQLSRPDKKGEEEKNQTFLNLNRPGISFYFGPNNNSNNNFELVRIQQRRSSVFLVCVRVCVCARALFMCE